MSRRGRTESGSRNALVVPTRRGYFERSGQPLHILVFLLPVLVGYELGLLGVFGTGAEALEAHRILVRFFELFGAVGLHLPSAAIVAYLLIRHAITERGWGIRVGVLALMLLESTILTVPLILIVMLIDPSGGAALVSGDAPGTAAGRVMLAFGAGLYEELLFRLVIITILHFLLADTLGFKQTTASVIGVALSALAFAFHHDKLYLYDGSLNPRLGLFYVLAGIYFGVLFLARGFGIVVGVHVIYDLLAFVILDAQAQDP